ncbi:MAG: V-type ATP synthase subunit I [Spirochaetales bacterium]
MKRVHVLGLSSKRKEITKQLGTLGTVHVTVEPADSDRLSELRSHRERVQRALRTLPEARAEDKPKHNWDASELVDRILELAEESRELGDRKQRLELEAEKVSPWEDVSPEDLAALESAGFRAELYVLKEDDAAGFSGPGHVFTVYESKDRVHKLAVGRSDEAFPDGNYPRPERTLSDVEAEMGELKERSVEIADELQSFSASRGTIVAELERVDRDIEFEQVRSGMNEEGTLLWFAGWVPKAKVSALRAQAREYGWGLLVRDPQPDEEPPVLVERRGVSRLIEPVFNLINTTPGYRERDISFPFLLFLTVFFAMILSDAGYGVLLVLAGGVLAIRNKVRGQTAGLGLLLLMVMGTATVIWGAMSGVWFGYEPIAEMEPFSNWVIPELFAFEPGSIEAVIAVCFVLALIHLSLARIWNTVRQFRGPHKLKAFAELGWLAVLVGMFNLALTLVVSAEQYPFLPVSLYLIIGGIGAVIVFSNQEGNFFRGALKGLNFTTLISTGLDGINAFADTMSYLRLFAVGLASVEIAAATNQLASLAGEGLGLPAAILIIVFGHSLNLAMGGLSVLVHGVRLNMLEFSGALGMEWSGSDYKPFRYNT